MKERIELESLYKDMMESRLSFEALFQKMGDFLELSKEREQERMIAYSELK
jgi:hypothetical protein